MKVADLIKMFSFYTRYKLIGAKTGKTLYKSWVNKNFDKFKDLDVADTFDSGFFPSPKWSNYRRT